LQVFIHKVLDVSAERKTAELVAYHVWQEILELEDKYGAEVLAIISDAAAEARKARKIILHEKRSVVILDGFAHQCNLIVAGGASR
jgi:hypothetical protein